MATTGAANNYVLNITELQNVVTTASGLTPTSGLAKSVAEIQQMVIFGEKRIATNTISIFNQSPIQVIDPMNFSGTGSLTVGGATVYGGTGSAGTGPTGAYGPTGSYGPTGPTGPSYYVAPNPAIWLGSAPTTTQAAIDRMSNLLYTLNSSNRIP